MTLTVVADVLSLSSARGAESWHDRVTRSAYALRPMPTDDSRWLGCALCTVRSRPSVPRSRRRWATVREPVLDTTGAALLWAGMAVDLATRPLDRGPVAVDAGRLRVGGTHRRPRSRSIAGSR